MRIISLGAGVQSTTLLLMALEGRVQADRAIFADTQDEPAAVYRHLEMLRAKCAASDFPLDVVTAGRLADDLAQIPAYVVNRDGSHGMTGRQCSTDYKLVPIRRRIRELIGRKRTARATQLMGISLDEVQRMKTSPVPWLSMEYPLVDLRMTRWDCQRFNAERGIEAPKSACVYCPYHSDTQWRTLTPAEFARACAVEDTMRAQAAAGELGLDGDPFLHRNRIPLREIDLTTPEDHGQQVMAWSECEGLCGV